ncbi:hypothetical protein [Yinghuangia soli]|uniref:Uncharacterized protein n=1 Tax=Yinghuangia soli TaxID=2908204 RepID=A0AA41U1L2_9ACTN|nr:hypothetical protein [Yinghuangia soli]MCF2529756.1 hypothetical protein [Yinghuangia soli]
MQRGLYPPDPTEPQPRSRLGESVLYVALYLAAGFALTMAWVVQWGKLDGCMDAECEDYWWAAESKDDLAAWIYFAGLVPLSALIAATWRRNGSKPILRWVTAAVACAAIGVMMSIAVWHPEAPNDR